MPTQTISIDFPNDILLALNASENDLKKQVKITLAMEFYKLQKLTIGKAAQLSEFKVKIKYPFQIYLKRMYPMILKS